jgi:hypothetical protein
MILENSSVTLAPSSLTLEINLEFYLHHNVSYRANIYHTTNIG